MSSPGTIARGKARRRTGLRVYLDAVGEAFGNDIDDGMLVKIYGASPESAIGRYSPAECIGCKKSRVAGHPERKHIGSSYVERSNLSRRTGMRRFRWLSNAFSKKLENHLHALALYFTFYNSILSTRRLDSRPPSRRALRIGFAAGKVFSPERTRRRRRRSVLLIGKPMCPH